MLGLLAQLPPDGDDWLEDDMPDVLARFGPTVLPELTAFLMDPSRGSAPRCVVADAVANLGDEFPEVRDNCVDVLTQQLEQTSRHGAIQP